MNTQTWTHGDEQRFNEMLIRRTLVMDRRDGRLRSVAEKTGFKGEALEVLIAGLKDNADEFLDALDPYDSGVRCSQTDSL